MPESRLYPPPPAIQVAAADTSNPFDAFDEAPATVEDNPFDAFDEAPAVFAPVGSPAVAPTQVPAQVEQAPVRKTKPAASGLPANPFEPGPAPPPAPQDLAAAALYAQLSGLPVLGPALQAVRGGLETTGRAGEEFAANPLGASLAAGAGGIAGLAGLVDDAVNVTREGVRQVPPELQQALIGAGGLPAELIFAFSQGEPLRTREALLNQPYIAPFFDSQGGTGNAAAVGEFLGQAAIPLSIPVAGALSRGGGIARALLGGAVEGGLTGETFGTVAGVGQQIKQGAPVDVGRAAGEALPAMLLGGVAGAGGAGIAKGLQKLTLKKGEPLKGSVEENVAVDDASEVRIQQAVDAGDEAALNQLAQEIEQQFGAPVETPPAEVPVAAYQRLNPEELSNLKLQADEFDQANYSQALEPIDISKTTIKRSYGGRFFTQTVGEQIISPRDLPQSTLQARIDELNIEIKRPSLKPKQKRAINDELRALVAETARRENRLNQGWPVDWAQEGPPRVPTDLSQVSDSVLLDLNEQLNAAIDAPENAGQVNELVAELNRVAEEADRRQAAVKGTEPPAAPEDVPFPEPTQTAAEPAVEQSAAAPPVTEPVTAPVETGQIGDERGQGEPAIADSVVEPEPQTGQVETIDTSVPPVETPPETGQVTEPRFYVEKTKGGYLLKNREEPEFSQLIKESEAKAQARADQLNTLQGDELQASLNRGRRPQKNQPQPRPPETKPTGELIGDSIYITERLNRPEAIEAGRNLPPERQQQFVLAAEANRNFQTAKAKYAAAVKQFFNDLGFAIERKKLTADQNVAISEMVSDAIGPAERVGETLTGMAASKPRLPAYDFGEAKDIRSRLDRIKQLKAEMDAADTAWFNAKTPLFEAMQKGEIPDHVIFGEGADRISFQKEGRFGRREMPPEVAKAVEEQKQAFLLSNQPKFDVTEGFLDKFEKALGKIDEQALNAQVSDLANSMTVEEALTRALKGDRGDRVLKALRDLGFNDPQTLASGDALTAVALGAAKLAKPATSYAGKVLDDFVGDVDRINPFLRLRRSLDIIEDHNPALHAQIWQNIGREAVEGRGLGFDRVDKNMVDAALKMSGADILKGQFPGFETVTLTIPQRRYLVARKALRQNTAKLLQAEIERIEKLYPEGGMDFKTETALDTMEQMERELSGRQSEVGTKEIGFGSLTRAMYDYIFKLNPSFHALNRLDPLIVGSSRAGFGRIIKAQALLARDAQVRKFIHGIEGRGTVEQLRADIRHKSKAAKSATTLPGKVVRKLLDTNQKISDAVPDFPSERWNINDSLAAGFIMHGDKTGYKGGGVQFLKDLAAGKIKGEAEVDAFVQALKVSNDITGSGSLGLDKDVLGRMGPLGRIFQFISQPLRYARLVRRYALDFDWKALGTLLGLSVLAGGNAAIPKEAEFVFRATGQQEKLYALQNLLDDANLVAKVPVFGRDLSDKLKWSLLPIFSAQANVVYDTWSEGLQKIERGQSGTAAMSGFLMFIVPQLFGVGGGTVARVGRMLQDVGAGKRAVFVPEDTFIGEGRIIGQGERSFNVGDALLDLTLPGNRSDVGRAITTTQQAVEFKNRFGKLLPDTLPAFKGLVTRKQGTRRNAKENASPARQEKATET